VKLAISNIAWQPSQNGEMAALLQDLGVTGVEIAPTMLSPDPLALPVAELRRARAFWETHGIRVVALQSLLFGHPEFNLFGSEAVRRAMLDYLRGMIALSAELGARILVFGSPRNRQVNELPAEKAQELAVGFFRELAETAAAHDACFCIEPNAPAYACDFVTNTNQALALIEQVDHPGFGLHLDAGVMALNEEPAAPTLTQAFPYLRHFHVSEPHLGVITEDQSGHRALGEGLRELGYKGWVSIEMRGGQGICNMTTAGECLRHALACYGPWS
jgi:D-psicose/D-tagatose/L-ribulose 3-epimerase